MSSTNDNDLSSPGKGDDDNTQRVNETTSAATTTAAEDTGEMLQNEKKDVDFNQEGNNEIKREIISDELTTTNKMSSSEQINFNKNTKEASQLSGGDDAIKGADSAITLEKKYAVRQQTESISTEVVEKNNSLGSYILTKRKQKEINAKAMAKGSLEQQLDISTENSSENDAARRQKEKEMNAFAAMANGSLAQQPDSPSDKFLEEDAIRRREEMNAFAAMANGSVAQQHDDTIHNVDEGGGARRQREMNAFAAMANGSLEQQPDSPRQKFLEEDAIRRRNEMNAFAAMANGSLVQQPDSPSEKFLEEDDIRRRKEMNAFAAMANGSLVRQPDSPICNVDKGDDVRRQREMNDFAAMANRSLEQQPNSPRQKFLEEDAIRRRNEMNAFAAMANGSLEQQPDSRSNKFLEEDAVRRRKEMNTFAAMANGSIVQQPDSPIRNVDEGDSARRQEEMNAFAAMANGSLVAQQPNSPSDKFLEEDVIRRQREMNAFAAMANGSLDLQSDSPNEKNLEEDAIRRRKEMNAFAAMANGSLVQQPGSPIRNVDKEDDARRREEINAFAAMASGSLEQQPNSPSDKFLEEDAIRRQREMNAFAAMANGSLEQQPDSPSEKSFEEDIVRRQQEMSAFAAMANGSPVRIESKTNLRGNGETLEKIDDNSGTFVNDKKSSSNDSNRNLDAALASLDNNTPAINFDVSKVELDSLKDSVQIKQRKPQFSDMYSECIRIAKPLFFGHTLPPRIISEMNRQQTQISHLLSDGLNKESSVLSNRKNLENALTVFGHGLDLEENEAPPESEVIKEMHNYITLFEPVWGDFRRLYREDRIKNRIAQANEAIVDANRMTCDHKEGEAPLVSSPLNSPEMESKVPPSIDENCNLKESQVNNIVENCEVNLDEDNKKDQINNETANSSDLFLQYARGEVDGYGDSFNWEKRTLTSVPESKVIDSNTFRQITDSNGSFEGSELKKQVGLNDNLSKALESLALSSGDGGTTAASLAAADAGAAAIEAARAISVALKDGRPLTNLEMAGGRVPLYGCDDDPLPDPNDLGIYETKEDQIQSIHQYESQEIIASRAVPNIFGPIVCPSNCLGPDDSQSWFSHRDGNARHSNGYANSFRAERNHPLSSGHSRTLSNTDQILPPLEDRSELPSPLPPPPLNAKFPQPIPRSRAHNGRESTVSFEKTPSSSDSRSYKKGRGLEDHHNVINLRRRIGWWNISDDFGLKPKKEKPKDSESSLQLPPLRDETRHDFSWTMYPSQAKLTVENRSFAELHSAVDTVKCLPYLSDRNPHLRHVQIDTQIVGFPSIGEVEPMFCSLAIWHVETSTAPENDLPIVNWSTSGRITESLSFDVVSDPEVEENCQAALWPYHEKERLLEVSNSTPNCQLQGTRCGVFPLHTQYDMANLYAVLIVHKTLVEESELDMYMNPLKQKMEDRNQQIKNTTPDLSKLRMKAGKASDRFGQFLMPFAFGVAPLVQILGSTPPLIPTSRAAQIPLFKLIAGEGDKPIINHILAVTNSSSSERMPAELTKDGTAMLVMRNFGYLGVHSSIHPQSKLACSRLVDFTGDTQVTRRREGEQSESIDDDSGRIYAVDVWHKDFIGEPTIDGGRSEHRSKEYEVVHPNSPLYAQEVAQVPLSVSHGKNPINYSNTYFHTSFCNELLLGPRLLHNCAKRNITIKIEIRQLQFSEDLKSLLAVLPDTPMIHNSRRGPFLINDSYTSCAYHKVDPQFMDDFKIKLPLNLMNRDSSSHEDDGKMVALFSVYNISVKGRKKWSLMTTKVDEDDRPCSLELLGCGYLPLSTNDNAPYLIADGLHNVNLKYITKTISPDIGDIESEGGNESVNSTDFVKNDIHSSTTLVLKQIESLSKLGENNNDDELKGKLTDTMILQVRSIAFSSLHAQNTTLSKFFQSMPQAPLCHLHGEKNTFAKLLKEPGVSLFAKEEEDLLLRTMNVVKSTLCPTNDLVTHFLRIHFQLWRTLVCGIGEPSLIWANPESRIALRLHSFVSLLQVLNGVSLCLTKVGVAELNGKGKWSMAIMSKIVLMLFDEQRIFPGPSEEEILKPEGQKSDKCRQENLQESKNHDVAVNSLDNKPSTEQRGVKAEITNKSLPQYFIPHAESDLEFVNERNFSSNSNSQSSSQDDINVFDKDSRPIPLRARSASAPNVKALKIDTKTDFQTALNATISPASGSPFGSASNGPAANRRKWMTAPSSSLATIQEDNDKIDERHGSLITEKIKEGDDKGDALDTELFKTKSNKVKQFRVPKLQQISGEASGSINSTSDSILTEATGTTAIMETTESLTSDKVVPKTDDEIADAGTAFLDMVGKNLGYSVSPKELGDEERRVGVSHHRKTRSRCSIDWSLPSTDLLIENYQEMEIFNRHESNDFTNNNGSFSSIKTKKRDSMDSFKSDLSDLDETSKEIGINQEKHQVNHPIQKQEEIHDCHEKELIALPSYHERITSLKSKKTGRWFPYVYEVIIFQWAAILSQQTRRHNKSTKASRNGGFAESSGPAKLLKEAAHKARGVSIACAPILFDIIKQSLGFRINSSLGKQRQNCPLESKSHTRTNLGIPLLVTLDKTIISTLEELISTVTDACIDSRNFDSWSFRHTSIMVNDSIARFLRDLFAFLDTKVVHRLVLIYFQRFVLKEGKQWQDRDSKIGLRCSWEIYKLRLNSITLFIRFSDFIKVNKPLMETWGPWSLGAPTRSTRRLFSDALDELEHLEMSRFALDGPVSKENVRIPEMESHWLIELITDICLSATGHVEQNIQHRAAALLYELFWSTSLQGKVNGSLTVLTSMYIPFITKILSHISFLSNLPAKSQVRKDLLTCVVFVMQSAPFGLLRALWRKLCDQLKGKGDVDNNGGSNGVFDESKFDEKNQEEDNDSRSSHNEIDSQTILDVCALLNLSLKTFEYEGSEANLEEEVGGALNNRSSQWKREYISAVEEEYRDIEISGSRMIPRVGADLEPKYTSTSSRKWFSHDGAIVIINASRNIVREYLCMLRPSEDYASLSGPIGHFSNFTSNEAMRNRKGVSKRNMGRNKKNYQFSYEEKVTFSRAIASVYLNCLSLRQSDIVFIKTLIASIEILKVFGIELFLAAVGETLQHWMRIILVHCGARRAKVRVEASDFLALILRLTWDSYGSFFRVRVPLLAVQTEVMERIVATAAARYYREQRRLKVPVEYLSNECAEAALTPLWRTLHRLHHSSASNNAAFKSALELLAGRMKTLYKAYIAAHALAIVTRTNNSSPRSTTRKKISKDDHLNFFQVKRVVMESAGFSKKILGNRGFSPQENAVTHSEAVEDSFLAAADIFSPTELPLHRIAWLRKLADFHSTCQKFAEEGACRLEIHKTLRQAAKLHEHLWSSIPFWPWASDSSDGVHLNGEGPAGASGNYDPGDDFEENSAVSYFVDDGDSGKLIEQNQSFRRIFYRVANSVRMRTGDWDVGGNKTLFYGVTFASEFNGVPPWISLREIEEDMVEEAEAAGELFLQAGLVESSRFCWSMATQFYSEMFNYAKLAFCYRKLALVVASKVPVVDTSNQLEISSPLGRFYRVYFHGGAADELMGKEYVYRASVSVKLEEFCESLRKVLTSILPEKTPISLDLDDGRPKEEIRSKQRRPLGAVPREAITIKVTPLKPLLMHPCPRGTSEWFYRQTEIVDFSAPKVSKHLQSTETFSGNVNRFDSSSKNRYSSISTASSKINRFGRPSDGYRGEYNVDNRNDTLGGGAVVGVKKFSFTQSRDRLRGGRDILKAHKGDVFEKSLRVTELLVDQSLPNCVTRQAVIQRTVFNQSPLEAGVEVVCSWCSVLFRTAVATNGQAVIGHQVGQGIGTRAEKVVADCIHKSRVKEIGRIMLQVKESEANNENLPDAMMSLYEKLSHEEAQNNQKKLARAIVIFMELLHVLVGRNRDLLLTALENRKRRDASSTESYSERGNNPLVPPSPGQLSTTSDGRSFFPEDAYNHGRGYDDGTASMGFGGASASSGMDRTDKAMAIQRELQKAFIAMNKVLQPIIARIIHSESPRWMKTCCQDSYFSAGLYRQARIAMGEELLFFGSATDNHGPHDGASHNNDSFFLPLSILPTQSSSSHDSYGESTTNSRASDSFQSNRF